MKVFVTGGTGFIGRRVVSLFKKRNHTVYLMRARLAETAEVEKELRKFKPDAVVHLAWEGIPDYGAAASAKNLSFGASLLSLLAQLEIKKVVAIGSCFEYDDKNSGHWPNTVAKSALRELGLELFRTGGVFVWAVPFFVYGVGKPEKSLVPALIAQARRGKIPVAKNDVALDFVYVDDVVYALALLAEKKVVSGTYDIGSGKLTRTVEIASEVARAYHVPQSPIRAMRKRGRVANLRALKKLGWKPEFSIRKGIEAMKQELHE